MEIKRRKVPRKLQSMWKNGYKRQISGNFWKARNWKKQKKLENLRTPDVAILTPCSSSNNLDIYQPSSCTENTHAEGQILIDNIEKSDLSAVGGTRDDINYED